MVKSGSDSSCCQCYGPPVPDRIFSRKSDTNLGEFVSFLVILPIAMYAFLWHQSPLKPIFLLLASLLMCQFFLFFEPSEMKELFMETAYMVMYGLNDAKDYLVIIKEKIGELISAKINRHIG